MRHTDTKGSILIDVHKYVRWMLSNLSLLEAQLQHPDLDRWETWKSWECYCETGQDAKFWPKIFVAHLRRTDALPDMNYYIDIPIVETMFRQYRVLRCEPSEMLAMYGYDVPEHDDDYRPTLASYIIAERKRQKAIQDKKDADTASAEK